jgi:hypothetical protein
MGPTARVTAAPGCSHPALDLLLAVGLRALLGYDKGLCAAVSSAFVAELSFSGVAGQEGAVPDPAWPDLSSREHAPAAPGNDMMISAHDG